MKVILKTKRLLLRQFDEKDLENLVELDSDPEVLRYISDGQIPSREDLQQVLVRILEQYRQSDRYGLWACESLSSHEFLGWFHMRPFKEAPEEIELGYRLKRSAWGKGFATEGSLALLKQAFVEWKTQKVVATTMEENLASRHVMEKLGMALEKHFIETRFPGSNQKAVKYCILANQFLSERSS